MTPVQLAISVLVLPLASAAVIALFLRRSGGLASLVSVLAATGIAGGSLLLAFGGKDARFTAASEWLRFGDFAISIGFKFDDLAALMLSIVGVVDTDPGKVGTPCGNLTIQGTDELPALIEDNQVIVGVVAVPAEAAQRVADELVRAGIRIVFNYSGALIDVPPHVTAHTTSPAVELLYALYFHLA